MKRSTSYSQTLYLFLIKLTNRLQCGGRNNVRSKATAGAAYSINTSHLCNSGSYRVERTLRSSDPSVLLHTAPSYLAAGSFKIGDLRQPPPPLHAYTQNQSNPLRSSVFSSLRQSCHNDRFLGFSWRVVCSLPKQVTNPTAKLFSAGMVSCQPRRMPHGQRVLGYCCCCRWRVWTKSFCCHR